jgi:predicted DNA-binding protein
MSSTVIVTRRRREPPAGLDVNVLFRCRPEMRDAVEHAADAQGRTMASICREAVAAWLDQHPDLTPDATTPRLPAGRPSDQQTPRPTHGGDAIDLSAG